MTLINSKFQFINQSYKFKNSLVSCLESKSRTYFKVLKNNKIKHLNNQTKLFRHENRECLTINITKDEPRIVIASSIHSKSIKLKNVARANAPQNTTQFIMDDFNTRNELCNSRISHNFENDWNEREI